MSRTNTFEPPLSLLFPPPDIPQPRLPEQLLAPKLSAPWPAQGALPQPLPVEPWLRRGLYVYRFDDDEDDEDDEDDDEGVFTLLADSGVWQSRATTLARQSAMSKHRGA